MQRTSAVYVLIRLQLIKKLSSTPVIPALGDSSHGHEMLDPQTSLQANKATFFFRVVCVCYVLSQSHANSARNEN